MTDEERRIRSYLTAQGAKLSPAELIEKVRAAMDDLHAALSAVPGSRFAERPVPDEWSANEVMAHVVNAGARFSEGINRALDGTPAGPDAHLDRAIEHGMFGALNWRETLLFLRLHDLDHAGQLKNIAARLA